MNAMFRDSLSFLKVARETVCESIKVSYAKGDIKKSSANELYDYFQNEATDYEVMHVLVRESMPTERYNTLEEHKLFDEFKNVIVENAQFLAKCSHPVIVENMIENLMPISEFGVDTAAPYLQRLTESGALYTLSEKSNEPLLLPLKRLGDTKEPSKFKKLGSGISDKASKFKEFAKGHWKSGGNLKKGAMIAGTLAIIAGIAYGAKKAYQAVFSKNAQACQGHPDQAGCIQQARVKAKKAKAQVLQSGMSKCNQAKNPAACKKQLQSKIKSMKK